MTEKQVISILTHYGAGWTVFNLRTLTIAAVLQIGPDYVFLREAEHAQSPASHAGVNYHPCVRHQVRTLKEASPGSHTEYNYLVGSRTMSLSTMSLSVGVCLVVPDVSNLWSVLEEPAVGDLVLPANIPGVLPQETDLLGGVSCVPEGVPQILPRTSLGLHNLVIKSLY